MSLKNNSDYEVISNAELSSVLCKYSPGMVEMILKEILLKKNNRLTDISNNMVSSYENNFKIDSQKFSQFQSDMLERRTELYLFIIDEVCNFHNLTYQEIPNTDIYSSAYYIYQFLVSGFRSTVITFFINLFKKEADEICNMLENSEVGSHPLYQFTKKRYGSMSSLANIHGNLNQVLDMIGTFGIEFENIIDIVYSGSYENVEVANFLKNSLKDNGYFFKDFIIPAVSGNMRPTAVTDIRLGLLPPDVNLKDFISSEE